MKIQLCFQKKKERKKLKNSESTYRDEKKINYKQYNTNSKLDRGRDHLDRFFKAVTIMTVTSEN